jgi:hypothetical protein
VGASSIRSLGEPRRVAAVDLFIVAGAADRTRVHVPAACRAGAVPLGNVVSPRTGGYPNRQTSQFRAGDTDANAGEPPNAETEHHAKSDSNPETHGDVHPHAHANPNSNSKADLDSNTNPDPDSDSNTHPDSNTNTRSSAADVQSRLHHRDGERGVDQPDW